MHIAEGILSAPVLIISAVAACGLLMWSMRGLDQGNMALAALLGAAFLVASTLHVPLGPGSVHLVLNGLAGLLLGRAVCSVFFVALLLQAALFSFGGFMVLGANLLTMALPALLVGCLGRALLHDGAGRSRLVLLGICCGVLGIGCAGLIACSMLYLSGGAAFAQLISLIVVAHIPVMLIDSLISTLVLLLLARLQPTCLPGMRTA